MSTGTFTADAVIVQPSFTADAVLVLPNFNIRHYRDRDHDGVLRDSVVVNDAVIGSYTIGETLNAILADLWTRSGGT